MTNLWYYYGHLGCGHIKITVILRSNSFWNQMEKCFDFYPQVGGWLSTECSLIFIILTGFQRHGFSEKSVPEPKFTGVHTRYRLRYITEEN